MTGYKHWFCRSSVFLQTSVELKWVNLRFCINTNGQNIVNSARHLQWQLKGMIWGNAHILGKKQICLLKCWCDNEVKKFLWQMPLHTQAMQTTHVIVFFRFSEHYVIYYKICLVFRWVCINYWVRDPALYYSTIHALKPKCPYKVF